MGPARAANSSASEACAACYSLILPRLLTIAVALALALPTGLAAAQPGGADRAPRAGDGRPFIAWDAPDGCPDEAAFDAMLAAKLGGARAAEPLHIEVRVERTGRRYTLTIRTTSREGSGERTLQGRDCAVLAETAALALSLAIAPEGATGDSERPPEPAIDSEKLPGPEVTAAAPRPRERGVDLALRALVAGDVGSMPGAGPGVGLALGVRLARWRVEAYAAYWFEQTAYVDGSTADGADLSTMVGGLRGCYDLLRRRLSLGACLFGELSRTRARGFGGFSNMANDWVWPSVGGGPSIAVALANHWRFRADVELVGRPLERPQFQFDVIGGTPDTVHTPAWVAGRASAGLEVTFP